MSHHIYYSCDPDNSLRIVDGRVVRFNERFVGPPGRAHGGMGVASLLCPALKSASDKGLANPVASYVSGRLHAPVPLETDLIATVEPGDPYKVAISLGEKVMISGSVRVADAQVSLGEEIQLAPEHLASDLAELSKQANANPGGLSLFEQDAQFVREAKLRAAPNVCFGCGEKEQSLKLSYRLTDKGDIWSEWPIDADLVENGDRIADAITVSALDCANLWIQMAQEDQLGTSLKANENQMWITGSHSVHLLRVPPASAEYRIMSRHLRTEGRKGFCMSALIDSDGEAYAVAEAVNILIDVPPEMRLQPLTN